MNASISRQLFDAIMEAVTQAADQHDIPVAWPGVPFEAPEGPWAELNINPNTPVDNGLSYGSTPIERGVFTLLIWGEPGAGVGPIIDIADQFSAEFPKGRVLSGMIRVYRNPEFATINSVGGRSSAVLTISFSG